MVRDPSARVILLVAALGWIVSAHAAPRPIDPPDADRPLVQIHAGSSPASSDPPAQPVRPRAARRIVRLFDFEEADLHDRPTPLHWHRAQHFQGVRDRPSYPIWNRAVLDYAVASSGIGSVALPTAGGSTALELDTGVIPVFPGADYRITTRVRTQGLTVARARIAAAFLDAANQPIPGSRVVSDLVRTDGDWQDLAIELWGINPDAAYITIELELLQPDQFDTSVLNPHESRPADISGSAWFDDVTVLQIPRIAVTPAQPLAVFAGPDVPVLRILAQDLAGQTLTARATVYDIDDRPVAVRQDTIDPGGTPMRWTPAITKRGWYTVELEVMHGSTIVGTDTCTFVWVDAIPSSAPREDTSARPRPPERFALVVRSLRAPLAEHLARLLEAGGVGAVSLPAWPDGAADADRAIWADRLDRVLSSLRDRWVEPTIVVPSVPPGPASDLAIESDQLLAWLTSDHPDTAAFLDPLLSRFGQAVGRWQLGRADSDEVFWLGDAQPTESKARDRLAKLVPGPALVVPTRLERPPASAAAPLRAAEPCVLVPPSLADESAFDALAEALPEPSDRRSATLVLDQLDPRLFTQRQIAGDLARSAVLAWAALATPTGAPRLAIVEPWSWTSTHRPRLAPSPNLAAWRTLAGTLSDRTVIAQLPVGPHARCFVLAPNSGQGPGALVGWSDTGRPVTIEARLADGPVTLVDLFSNRSSLALGPSADGRFRVHTIVLTPTPIVVEGIDPQLAAIQGALRFEPQLIAASTHEHDRSLVLTNPWPHTITGRAVLLEPLPPEADGSWTVHPRAMPVAIAAEQTAQLDVTVAISPFEPAGPVPVLVSLTLDDRPTSDPIPLRSTARVGLDRFDLRLTRVLMDDPASTDLILQARIANLGADAATIELTLVADGPFDRQTSVISQLAPGANAVRRFAYPNGAAILAGQRVYVSAQDTLTRERLNESIAIPRPSQPATADAVSPRSD